jgi:uncharacterized small protein (DUF1192 family)
LLNLNAGQPAREEELGMAKQKKIVGKSRQHGNSDTVLLRSAEALGRLIGALQREIDRVTAHLPTTAKSAAPRKRKARAKPRKARL